MRFNKWERERDERREERREHRYIYIIFDIPWSAITTNSDTVLKKDWTNLNLFVSSINLNCQLKGPKPFLSDARIFEEIIKTNPSSTILCQKK
jgi:hypothetical protein